ncbi:hypothetical protein ACQ4M3_42075 [Leptolyngbya sp. AN03gr2]|uniref:hypothetical protein n=1 Tax=unclassified Leptolyngbya TaxID=2650499 RepID=UPI003D31A770
MPQHKTRNITSITLTFLLLGILFVVGGTIWCLLVAGFAAMATQTLRGNDKVSS